MEHKHHQMLPVWFFIGVLLLAYGMIILAVGIFSYNQPSTVILAQYHAPIWGGVLLCVLGLFYTVHFWPRKKRQ